MLLHISILPNCSVINCQTEESVQRRRRKWVDFLHGKSKRALLSEWLIDETKYLRCKCCIINRTLLYCVLFIVFFGLSRTFTNQIIYGSNK